MTRISSGVYGLNPLMGGGFRKNTLTVVIGSSGAGKTTMATQYLRRGLEQGEEGIYITLDEPPEQLKKEAQLMGFDDIDEYLDDELLVYVDATGREFTKFVKEELADFVDEWKGSTARLVIDPLTPVIWSLKDPADQRDIISYLFRQTKKIGTVLCTLEEHGTLGTLSGPETIIPMYLADNVIHLRYIATNDLYNREVKVIKMRSSNHSNHYHPYEIIQGAGVIILEVANQISEGRPLHIKSAFKDIYNHITLEDRKKLTKKQWKKILKLLEHADGQKTREVNEVELIRLVLMEYGIDVPLTPNDSNVGE